MALVTDRVRERAVEDFGTAATRVLGALENLWIPTAIDPERIHAAVVIAARGSIGLFDDAAEHAEDDWRDLLDRAGLADGDWPQRVLEHFGP
ncbi:hypothetical protein [Demequina sp. NBRC 110053]|uniref:hypothetical protein n=1 Tax=Demequina sp. NBRC 110053 TaxID=1570342 RepID=UPI0009FCF80D|nr:hypothetical protein [Demequina sp. NBRC 110053]